MTQWQAQPPPQHPPPPDIPDGMSDASAPAVLRPNTDSLRITCSLAQVGHATTVAAPGTYFSKSASHCLQRYS